MHKDFSKQTQTVIYEPFKWSNSETALDQAQNRTDVSIIGTTQHRILVDVRCGRWFFILFCQDGPDHLLLFRSWCV